MRSVGIIGAALFAVGSLAEHIEEKRAIEWATAYETVTQVVWVTAEGPAPTSSVEAEEYTAPDSHSIQHTHAVSSSAESIYSAPSSSSSSSAYVAPAPTSTYVAPPASSTYVAPASPSSDVVPVSVASSDVSSGSSSSFQETCVSGHNQVRSQHQAGELTWDDDLASSAAALAALCKFQHNVDLGPASGYGQNIAASWGTLGMHDESTEASQVITDAWYTKEAADFASLNLYGMANPLPIQFDSWGHFSQEVWISTTKVGCAVQACPSTTDASLISNGYFTVCNYDPPGNYGGEFATNVLN